jgi:hypothetical protein
MKGTEKEKRKTVEEIASDLVVALNETESVLNTFRNIGNFYFRDRIRMSDKELKEKLDADTGNFIRTRSEYETMYYFLEARGLMEKYAAFRAEVHAAIQAKIKPEGGEESK